MSKHVKLEYDDGWHGQISEVRRGLKPMFE